MNNIDHRHKEDVIEVMREGLDRGIHITPEEVDDIVTQYSENYLCAGWCLPSMDYIFGKQELGKTNTNF